MLLDPHELELFFRLHRTLLFFVNQRLKVVPVKITTPEEITVNELEIGSKVLVLGEQGDDGVITAQLVSEGAGLGTAMGG